MLLVAARLFVLFLPGSALSIKIKHLYYFKILPTTFLWGWKFNIISFSIQYITGTGSGARFNRKISGIAQKNSGYIDQAQTEKRITTS